MRSLELKGHDLKTVMKLIFKIISKVYLSHHDIKFHINVQNHFQRSAICTYHKVQDTCTMICWLWIMRHKQRHYLLRFKQEFEGALWKSTINPTSDRSLLFFHHSYCCWHSHTQHKVENSSLPGEVRVNPLRLLFMCMSLLHQALRIRQNCSVDSWAQRTRLWRKMRSYFVQ